MTKEETFAYIKAYLDGDTAVGNIIPLRSVLESAIKYLSEPSLPSDLYEAAEEELDDVDANWQIDERDDGCTEPGYNQKQMLLMFKAGAEWMAGQGYKQTERVYNFNGENIPCVSPVIYLPKEFEIGDKVVVQIRKK